MQEKRLATMPFLLGLFSCLYAITRMEGDKIFLSSEGKDEVLEGINAVVWATGFKVNAEARKVFQSLAPRVEFVGDCLQPANIERAVNLAYHIAYSL